MFILTYIDKRNNGEEEKGRGETEQEEEKEGGLDVLEDVDMSLVSFLTPNIAGVGRREPPSFIIFPKHPMAHGWSQVNLIPQGYLDRVAATGGPPPTIW